MGTFRRLTLNEYFAAYRHYWIEGLRIFLGLLLIYKGYYFVEHLEAIYRFIEETMPISAFIVAHYVVFAHLAGGAMIVFGILTRIAIIAQIPIVIIGAYYYSDGGSILFGTTTELEYSMLLLILLVVFFFYGSGKWSVDHWVLRRQDNG